MTLEGDLASWVNQRPAWQKDAISRFCRNEVLKPSDVRSIAEGLIESTHKYDGELRAEDIPGTSVVGSSVALAGISDVAGVNALLSGQELTFGPTGLTIVYGDNASGKSGYARLIREAVTTRISSDVLTDVFADPSPSKEAAITYVVSGVSSRWYLGDEKSIALSAARFYDEECGDAYITTASEVSYRPSALVLLDRLSRACEAIQDELNRRLQESDLSAPKLPRVGEGTGAAQFLADLSADTTKHELNRACRLSDDHAHQLARVTQRMEQLRASDPAKERKRLAGLVSSWRLVEQYCAKVHSLLGSQGVQAARSRREEALHRRQVAALASSQTFEQEPLTGVGTETWLDLWEAARAYSLAEAYPNDEFPHCDQGSVCLLCQQPLLSQARDRLTRFDEFVANKTSQDALDAEAALSKLRTDIEGLTVLPVDVNAAIQILKDAGESIETLEQWVAFTLAVASSLCDWIDGTIEDPPTPINETIVTPIQVRCAELEANRKGIDDTWFRELLEDLTRQQAELSAQSRMAESRQDLEAAVAQLQERRKIEQAKSLTDTTGITRKATELTKKYVTIRVREKFENECKVLDLRNVTLEPLSGRRNVTLEHRPGLIGASASANVKAVLSEGEQTALGLAGFLTEVVLDGSKSSVILDDPVSSLDAGRRSRVARRLVQLAKDRQVIIFTHEATFVTALNKAALDLEVEVTKRAMLRQGGRPGKTIQDHPWQVKDVPTRINELEADLQRLAKVVDSLDTLEYTQRAREWGGKLSQAWERAVNLQVVNELVDSGTHEVRPMKFRMLVAVSDQDNRDFQAGYGKASEWALRHDQAPETNFSPPGIDEMKDELERLRDWVKRLKAYLS